MIFLAICDALEFREPWQLLRLFKDIPPHKVQSLYNFGEQ